jgi:hypothetical protein
MGANKKNHTEAMMTSEKLCKRLLRVAIAGNLSFQVATNPEMIELLSEAWPDLDMPNHKGLKTYLMKLAVHGESNLKERLLLNKSKISIVYCNARARMRAKRLFIHDGQSNVVPLQSAISSLLGNAKGLGIARLQGLYCILESVQFLHLNCLDVTISSESNLNPLNILNPMPLFQSTLNS